MSQNTRKLTHSLLLSIRNQNQSSRCILRIRNITTIESTSLQLNDLVLLQVLASVVHHHSVLEIRND